MVVYLVSEELINIRTTYFAFRDAIGLPDDYDPLVALAGGGYANRP